jgi:serine/threonine-protein kinase
MTAQPTPFETAVPSLSVPGGMRDAIMKSLSKDREQRQASARDFFAELSGGARMTVTGDPPVAAGAKRSTAAMEAAPDFSAPPAYAVGGAAHAATAHAMPAAHAPAYPPHVPATVPAVVPGIPPAPMHTRGGKSGGGKGLLVGLGALGAVLLVAMAVIAARSMGKDEGPTTLDLGTTTATTPSAGPAATFGPLVTPPTTDPTATAAPTADTGIAGGAPTAKPTATATAKPTATATPTPTGGTKPPAGGDACDACIAAARSGSITSAAGKANSCSDATKKAQCVALVKASAPDAAKSAAFNGNCSQAKAIAAAAKAMGAGTAKLDKALGSTSCK